MAGDVSVGAPYVVIVALLAEAGSNGSAFLLNDGSLVGNGLGRTYIADELLHYMGSSKVSSFALAGIVNWPL